MKSLDDKFDELPETRKEQIKKRADEIIEQASKPVVANDCKCLGCDGSENIDDDSDETQAGMVLGGKLYECGSCGWEFCEARMSQVDDPDPLNNTCIHCDNYDAA